MVGRIVEYSTAFDIWASLNKEYESPSIATVMSLNSQLQRIKKIDIPLSEYLFRLKFVFDKFAAIGEPLSYRDKLTRIPEGLPEKYDSFVTSIHNRYDRPSFQEVHSLLHPYESRLSAGATHHLTPEFRHMTDAMQYSGGDHALIGNAPPTQAFLSQQNQAVLWHNRLGHPAPKVVCQVLQSWLSDHELILSKSDTSLFVLHYGSSITILLVYVDDIIVTGSLSYFLGIQKTSTASTLHLSQEKYISNLLHHAFMFECKPISTLMASTASISLYDGEVLFDPTSYRSIVGTLLAAPMTGKVLVTIVAFLAQISSRGHPQSNILLHGLVQSQNIAISLMQLLS
ncbi:hypothetical protein AAG906_004858 [Vitis piasezkii]